MARTVDGSVTIVFGGDTSGFESARKLVEKGMGKLKSSLSGFAAAAGFALSTAAVIDFGKESVKAAQDLSNAMQGLQSIVEGQGRSFSEAKAFINDYVKDGLVPMQNAVTAYKNLAARGYDDEQIKKVMVALKDAASFGRQASYSLGDAITSATEGLKNENSILVDNAGVTKNVAKMWEEYAKSIGTTAAKLTQEQKIQAEVNGILAETRFQTGDAAKISQTYAGQVAQLSYNFNNLKVAIGNAIIPILKAVLPYINAVVQAMTELFQALGLITAEHFGTQYGAEQADQLNGIADSAQNAAAAQDKLATSTKKAGKAAKDNIQSFDKLNVRQKDTSTASADTSTGAVSGTSAAPKATSGIAMKADIQDEVSPKVRRMADNIKDAIKKIADIINQFMPLIQGVGTAFGIVFAVGRIKKFIKVFEKIPGLIPLLTSLKMAIQRIGITALRGHSQVLRLTDGVNDTQKSLKGFMANLSPMQKAVVTIAGLAAVFTTAKSAFKDVAKGTRSIWSALCQLLPVVIAVGAAMMAMFPQHAVLAGVVAGITAVVGVIAGFAEAEKEAEQARIDEYFSGVAVSTEDLAESLAPMTERYDSLNQKMEEHRQKSQEISDEYNKASDSLDIMFTQLSAGETTVPNSAQVIYDGLIAVGESVKKSADEDASYYMSHWKEVFDNVGTLTSAEQGEILNNIQQLSIDKKKKVDEIEQEITKIHDGAKSRNVGKTVEYTKEELIKLQGFQDDLDALMSLERNKELEKSKIQSAQLYDDIKSGRKKVNKDTYQELLDEVAKGEQDAVDKAKEIQAEGLANAESNLTAARKVYGENSDEYEKAYADYTTMVDQTNREFTKAMEEAAFTANTTRTMLKEKLSEDLKPLDETQKKIDELAGVTNELANSSRNVQDFVNKGRLGAEEYKKLNDKVKELKEKQRELTKELENNDNASKDFFGTWKLKTPGLKDELKEIIGAVDTSIDKSVKTFASYGTSSADELKKGIASRYSEVKATSEKMGKNLTDGLSKGIKDNKKDSTKAVGDTADDMEKEFRKKTDTHSPSRKYKSLGEFLIQGLINGINDTKKAAIRAFTELFNAILDKAQKFSDRFRQGMSGTISGFAASMNSVTVNPKDGRIVYTKMPEVRIPKLATGAVIPPNSEFLAVLGDQKSGKNVEAPEGLIRRIVREEAGRSNNADVVSAINHLTQVLIDKRLIDTPEQFAREYQPYFDAESRRSSDYGIGGFVT